MTARAAHLLAVLAAASVSLAPLSAAQAHETPPAVTQHEARIAGKTVRYTAEIGRIAIRDRETGEPHGWMGYTAYRVSPTAGAPPRPVTFIWNGGPGAPSTLLHFSVAGPRRLAGGTLIDNDDSWLSATDLVLVDPIGTGFSRPAKAEFAEEFYGTVGDTMSVAEFVRSWRLLHGAEDAPIYLAGESWGAARAATVGYQLLGRQVPVAGLILISGGWALNKNPVDPALLEAVGVIDMAEIAAGYGKAAPEIGRAPATVRAAADQWVRSTYAPALARIDRLTESERDAVLAGLVRFTGIPAAQIDRRTLIVSPRLFRTTLLKDDGRQLYVFDLRRSDPLPETGGTAIPRYFRRELGYATDLPYLGLEDDETAYAPTGKPADGPAERWNYATVKLSDAEVQAAMAAAIASGSGPPKLGPPLPATLEAIARSPALRILVVGGSYDSFRPCAAGREIAHALPAALQRSIRFKCYAGGHAMYLDDPVRTEFSGDVRAFVSNRPIE